MTSTTQNVESAKRFLAAMSDGDVSTMDSVLTDDLDYWVAGSMPLSGSHTKSALLEMVPNVGPYFPNGLKVHPTETTAEGARVAMEAVGGG